MMASKSQRGRWAGMDAGQDQSDDQVRPQRSFGSAELYHTTLLPCNVLKVHTGALIVIACTCVQIWSAYVQSVSVRLLVLSLAHDAALPPHMRPRWPAARHHPRPRHGGLSVPGQPGPGRHTEPHHVVRGVPQPGAAHPQQHRGALNMLACPGYQSWPCTSSIYTGCHSHTALVSTCVFQKCG
jgi:hypothetical protein